VVVGGEPPLVVDTLDLDDEMSSGMMQSSLGGGSHRSLADSDSRRNRYPSPSRPSAADSDTTTSSSSTPMHRQRAVVSSSSSSSKGIIAVPSVIYLAGMNWWTTDQQVREWVEEHASVVDLQFAVDASNGKSFGHARMVVASAEDAEAVTKHLGDRLVAVCSAIHTHTHVIDTKRQTLELLKCRCGCTFLLFLFVAPLPIVNETTVVCVPFLCCFLYLLFLLCRSLHSLCSLGLSFEEALDCVSLLFFFFLLLSSSSSSSWLCWIHLQTQNVVERFCRSVGGCVCVCVCTRVVSLGGVALLIC
jgi:RNA recognition motif